MKKYFIAIIMVSITIAVNAQKRDTIIITTPVPPAIPEPPVPPATIQSDAEQAELDKKQAELDKKQAELDRQQQELERQAEKLEQKADGETDYELDSDAEEGNEVNATPSKLKDVKIRWAMLDYGLSTYMHDGSLNLPTGQAFEPYEQNLWLSPNWNIHLLKMSVNLIDHKVNLVTGLTFEFNKYRFTNNYDIPAGTEINMPVKIDSVTFRKNRLYTSWVSMPLMLNFETNPNKHSKSFHISAGVFGSALLAANIRQESPDAKRKVKDNFNLNSFRYGILGQIGYGPFTVFASYAANPMFKDGNSPVLYPFNFGVCLIPF